MLLRAQDLVLRVVLKRVEVLIALVAVIMFVKILFVIPHVLLGVKSHVAVLVCALDAPDGLECGWHLGGSVMSLVEREWIRVTLFDGILLLSLRDLRVSLGSFGVVLIW
jgi:hypothetical protein